MTCHLRRDSLRPKPLKTRTPRTSGHASECERRNPQVHAQTGSPETKPVKADFGPGPAKHCYHLLPAVPAGSWRSRPPRSSEMPCWMDTTGRDDGCNRMRSTFRTGIVVSSLSSGFGEAEFHCCLTEKQYTAVHCEM